jgi:isopropylmalate/homocitrate/citramalate synthase
MIKLHTTKEDEVHASLYNTPLGDRMVTIYDSTLRDGEQMPGVHFTPKQKIEIARALDDIHIPQIEAGFPVISTQERRTVREIASMGLEAEILCLSRVNREDIDAVIDCDVDMVLLFVATSDLHLQYKLKTDYQTVKERSMEAIEYAMGHGFKVSFSSEDSTRTPPERLLDLLGTAVDMGVDKVGFTDTVGCATPEAVSEMVLKVKGMMRERKRELPLSVHLHNDFGLGVANALSGVSAGADAVCVTVNGIGERAGNVPLEEFVMALKVLHGSDQGIDTTGLMDLSELVSRNSGVPIHRNKPFVGHNAFCHESGIHVAALLNNHATYEVIPPEMVGNTRHLKLGKHTGSTFVRRLLDDRGIDATPGDIRKITERVKALPEVDEERFWALVNDVIPSSFRSSFRSGEQQANDGPGEEDRMN